MKRNYGIDLLRILSMLMVIGLHYFGKGNYINESTGIFKIIVHVIESVMICAVNIFVLISGYVMAESKKVKGSKVINYFFQLWAISILAFIILKITGLYTFKKEDYIYAFLPFLTMSNWFFNNYILLYLTHPFINKAIENITQKQFKYLLVVLTMFLSILPTILPNVDWAIDLNQGHNILWLFIVYLYGVYLHKYSKDKKYNRKKIIYITKGFIYSALILISGIAVSYLNKFLIEPYDIPKIYSYTSILILLASINYFLFFKSLNINNKFIIKFIKFNTPYIFGVLLIHEHYAIRQILWKDILNVGKYINSYSMIHYFVICVLLIYSFCILSQFIITFILKKTKIMNYVKNALEKKDIITIELK